MTDTIIDATEVSTPTSTYTSTAATSTPVIATPFTPNGNGIGDLENAVISKVHDSLSELLQTHLANNTPSHIFANVASSVVANTLGLVFQSYTLGAPQLLTLFANVAESALAYAANNPKPVAKA